ncbi:replication-associated recombination protein A, partial [Pseudostreptobacillus sp.]
LGYDYYYLNAIKSGKGDIVDILDRVKNSTNKTILFFDEIHRFNKLQQDTLLEDLENGNIILIGATTESPFYSLNKAILSRVLLFEFKEISQNDIFKVLKKVADGEAIKLTDDVLEYLSNISDGDVRAAINTLEILKNSGLDDLDIEEVGEVLGRKVFAEKYDTISAMIKSVRGSDPNSAVYWMSKLLIGGEDIMYIARRLVILASEDIGLANVNALNIAVSCMNAVKEIGMPEARIILSECIIYLALSPKSNSTYLAVNKAFEEIEKNGSQDIPFHLTPRGRDKYIYPHDYSNHYIKQKYMNKTLQLYNFADNKFEKNLKEFWERIRKEEKNE